MVERAEEREEEYEKARRRIFSEMLRDKAGPGPGEKAVLHSDQRLHALANSKVRGTSYTAETSCIHLYYRPLHFLRPSVL